MTCAECSKPIPEGHCHEINDYKFCRECCEKLTARKWHNEHTKPTAVIPMVYPRHYTKKGEL